ncbi:MAG: efflux transporter outer membrane subunit, partial [Bacteroidales bacterium]|nr:efflux transporter outer membrane subunit [Bacteroidales bacterium]
MKKIIYPVILVILFIASCKMGPNFQKPVFNYPNAFINDSLKGDTLVYDSIYNDSLINLAWWELFQDSSLQNLIKKAVNNNQDYLITISRIEEARAALGYVRADLYPKVDINAEAKSSKMNLLGTPDNAAERFSIAPVISWEIDFWGKIRRATESAKASLLAAEYNKQKIMISLISDVISNYFLLLDYKARQDIARKTYETRKEYLGIITARFEKGVVPEIDVNQAQIQEAQAEAAIYIYERLIKKTEYILRLLIGENPGEILTHIKLSEQIIPPEIPPGLPSQLIERRPDIREAEQLLAAQNAQIGVAQAMRFPSFSLTAMFGLGSNELNSLISADGLIWSVGGQMLGPLFNFNKNNSPLPSNRIIKIKVDDSNGKVFFATDKGIVAFNNNVSPFGDGLGEVYAYPNPVKKEHSFVTIDGRNGTHLPRGTNVKILDSSGRLVHETNVIEGQELKGGKVIWNK